MLKKLLVIVFLTSGICYGQTLTFRASKLDSNVMATKFRVDTGYTSLLSKILAGSADSSKFATLFRVDTIKNNRVTLWKYGSDTLGQAAYRNALLALKANTSHTQAQSTITYLPDSLLSKAQIIHTHAYQAAGTYLVPDDSNRIRTGSNALYQTKNTATPGSYTNTNLTLDANGRITALSNGTGGSLELDTIYVSASVPYGTIAMWSGHIDSIPTNWQLCNGTNGTPDLRERFIVGAGNLYAVGSTGGQDSVRLSVAQMPRHTHIQQQHDHGMSEGTTDGSGNYMDRATNSNAASAVTDYATAINDSTGGNGYHENRPKYFALAYIMKVGGSEILDTIQVSVEYDTTQIFVYTDYTPWRTISNISKLSDSLMIVPQSSWYKTGVPIKYRANSGTEYYGLITNLKNNNSNDQDTLIISGATIPTSCDTVKYGDINMVVKVDFGLYGTWNNLTCSAGVSGTADSVLYLRGDTEFKWGRSNAYLVQWGHKSRTADAGTASIVPWKNNEILIGNYSQTNNATWNYSSSHYINSTNYNIVYGDYIDFRVTNSQAGTAQNLTLTLWFVLE